MERNNLLISFWDHGLHILSKIYYFSYGSHWPYFRRVELLLIFKLEDMYSCFCWKILSVRFPNLYTPTKGLSARPAMVILISG